MATTETTATSVIVPKLWTLMGALFVWFLLVEFLKFAGIVKENSKK